MKYATFFGGALNITDSKEYLDSINIGKFLEKVNYVVKSGGYQGLMSAISKGVTEAGGKAIGYTCKTFPSVKGNKYLTETVVTDDIFDRLRLLIGDSEIFIVQKGSFGTMAELFLTLDIIRTYIGKPDIYLIGKMWKDIFDAIELNIPISHMDYLIFCDDYDDFVNKFKY